MTTDITELAQSEINDALAQLKQISEYPTPSTQYARVLRKYIATQVEALENSESRLHEVAVACATAEQALEKAQQSAKERDEENQDLMLTIGRFRVEREGLEAIRAAAEKLVRCKGRYHSEQNYRALAALFGVNTPDLPPLDDKSRAVTVENLQESAYRAGLTAGWNLGLANNNDGFNKCLAAHAAGIKVEAE
ncbi:TPA: hypothetical protein ACJIX3_002714 [Klebsiella pneumoniae]